jgi:hypothetical protein
VQEVLYLFLAELALVVDVVSDIVRPSNQVIRKLLKRAFPRSMRDDTTIGYSGDVGLSLQVPASKLTQTKLS